MELKDPYDASKIPDHKVWQLVHQADMKEVRDPRIVMNKTDG